MNNINITHKEEKGLQNQAYKDFINSQNPRQTNTYTKFLQLKTPSIGIKDYIEKLENSSEPTILNIINYTKNISLKQNANIDDVKYTNFKTFFNSTVEKVSNELDNNKGPIIEAHLPPYNKINEYTDIMNEIVNKYKVLYLDNLNDDGKHNFTNENKQEIYPNYLEDLYNQSDKPYVDFEIKHGLKKPIVEQNDKEFFQTLNLRVQGLEECKNKLAGQYESAKHYFNEEYKREKENYENLNYPQLSKNKNNKNTQTTKNANNANNVNSQCKTIYYNADVLERSQNNIYKATIYEKFKTLFEKQEEFEFAKTFLPEDYFKDDNKEKFLEKIKELINSNNRDLRQFVFAHTKDETFSKLQELKPFLYEAGGMSSSINYKTSCNPFVNWSIMLNLLYCRCSLSKTKSEVLCPVRFILPEYNEPEFQIRDRDSLIDLFNNDNNATFLSIITIKFFHEQSKTYRVWFLYIFKNNKLELETFKVDTIVGIQVKYFIVNSNLKCVNTDSLFERHNVTHTELTFFVEYANKYKNIYFYKTKFDNRNIFISKIHNLVENTFLEPLKLKKISINLIKHNDNDKKYHKFKIKIIEDNQMKGGNKDKILYKITKTQKENNLFYSNNKICGNIYNIFLNNALFISNRYVLTENTNNKKLFFKCINLLNNYVLVSGTEIEFRANLLLNEIKKDSIPIYKPLSGISFYDVNEIFTKYNILSFLNKSSNILYIGSNYNLAELTKYKNYKLDNITAILLTNNNYYKINIEKWYEFIKNNKKIY